MKHLYFHTGLIFQLEAGVIYIITSVSYSSGIIIHLPIACAYLLTNELDLAYIPLIEYGMLPSLPCSTPPQPYGPFPILVFCISAPDVWRYYPGDTCYL